MDEVNLAVASLVFSALSLLVMMIGLIFIFYPDIGKTISANASGSGGIVDSLRVLGLLGGALSPDVVLLIGFLSDLMNLNLRYSVTSFIGIFAVFLHWVVGGAIFGFSKGTTQAVASAVETIVPSVAPGTEQAFGVGHEQPTILSSLGQRATATGRSVQARATQAATTATQAVRSAVPGIAAAVSSAGTAARNQWAMRGNTAARRSGPPSVPSEFSATGERGLPSPAVRQSRAASIQASAQNSLMAAQGLLGRRGRQSQGGGGLRQDIADKFNPCTIRGLGYFEIKDSPMGIAALSAIFTVYLLDMYVGNKRSTMQIGGYVAFSLAVFGLNVYAYKELCGGVTMTKLAVPLGVGLITGAGGYFLLSSNFANFLPLDGTKFDDGTSEGSAPGKNTPHCSAPNEEDQMVCDAYQNGRKITSVPVS